MALLRIDASRVVDGQPVLEYTHSWDTLPAQPSGTGCAWASVGDMLDHARMLRDLLAQPEQLVLLHVLAAFDLDAPWPTDLATAITLATLPGKIITGVTVIAGTEAPSPAPQEQT